MINAIKRLMASERNGVVWPAIYLLILLMLFFVFVAGLIDLATFVKLWLWRYPSHGAFGSSI